MDADLMPIGQFARLSRLSIKQLRHYAELGLLPPAHVDPDTGYRYYHPAQARHALTIGLLRSLDVPLATVADVLTGATTALDHVRHDLEAELDRRRRTLASLERLITDGLPGAPVRLTTEPSRTVLLTREHAAGPNDIPRATSAAIARLLTAAPTQRPPELTALFPIDLDDHIDITATLALTPGEAPSPAPGLERALLPGGTFASATHTGPYDQISLTAHAVLAWCAERGHPLTGPIREVYISDPATTPPDRLLTHLMIPIDPEEHP
ncbi:MerR family transcriptional regulator [Nonomuraea endophytica]|uniref:DNA-binding transcriptional MerR regulator n=1 Tax=Nonomuraea endophytica TaxID=714136 RepID=A0A7W8A8P4_9ACTN|nr:MerR family transcriptional regulator [Nonomuraea endophytica]MBB5081677.1 DNA-binding transcriptional MerR regulator [Nonomuraea endophytica]